MTIGAAFAALALLIAPGVAGSVADIVVPEVAVEGSFLPAEVTGRCDEEGEGPWAHGKMAVAHHGVFDVEGVWYDGCDHRRPTCDDEVYGAFYRDEYNQYSFLIKEVFGSANTCTVECTYETNAGWVDTLGPGIVTIDHSKGRAEFSCSDNEDGWQFSGYLEI